MPRALDSHPPEANVRDYVIITLTYWVFTLTDGALRMLVLLYLHDIGYPPLSIASLFLFYELFGVITNFLGGWIGARFGLKSTLWSGLALQLIALSMLALNAHALTVPFVMVAQGLSGIAKDLTKMSSKSYIKLVVPEHDTRGLMRWVALLTGSKNTLKGVGFFLGGLLLGLVGFQWGCAIMAAGILVVLATAWIKLPRAAGRTSSKVTFRSLVPPPGPIRWLSASRLFLFGSRDVWFVLALPIYLQTILGWAFHEVGGFLALWIIGYGFVQAAAPAFTGSKRDGERRRPPDAARLGWWTATLVLPMGAIIAALYAELPPELVLVIGLAAFGIVFAANSAIHSFLIVAYAEGDKVAMRVGFYYMANAMGRLVGTLLSGAVFQWAGQGQNGLVACIAVSIGFVLLSAVLCIPLRASERREAETIGTLPQNG
ncbi:MAG: organoarsenical effux MFS transporter ArsJ [Planctomycetota bacterium]|nr:organoarsenical effux MFS transporter ArsJ [Planctomycetota bacterium]